MLSPAPLKSRAIDSSPVFYGWVVLAAGTLGMMLTLPGQTVAVSVFIDPIMAELGLSRSAVAGLYGAASLGGALLLPFFGRWLDVYGPRVGVVAVALGFSAACAGMAFVVGPVSLFVGFLAIRSLGQGALSLVSQHVISQWFVRRRGFALGLSGVGLAAANTAFPLGIQALIAAFDWRTAYMALGALVLLVLLPVGGGLFRQRPERYGLVPDGRPGSAAAGSPIEETNLTRAQAVRTPTFWVFAAGSVSVAALATALIFHHFSLMALNGLDRTTAAAVFVPAGLFTAASNLLGGIALDRADPRAVLMLAMAALAASLLLVGAVSSGALLLVYGACLGVAMGTSSALSATVWAYYFGRLHLGGIKGLVQALAVAGTAIGPLPFALAYDGTGSFRWAIWGSLLVPLVLTLAAVRLREQGPQRA